MSRRSARRHAARPAHIHIQQHLLAQRRCAVNPWHMQRQRHMQAFCIYGHHLCAHLQCRAKLDLAQVVDMRFQREQRMRQGVTPGGVQPDAVHQTVHAVAE